ncbi:MAG: NADH-quinone oxidoreductase subunit NuoE [Corynebacteriales bacterium]|nr:NADH-quinone oxidoreductase subunit NuoE [Mycobacteriales bacterium]
MKTQNADTLDWYEPEFRSEITGKAAEIIARYPEGKSRSALLPMLHLTQAYEGYVSASGIAFCAETLGLTKAEVAAVATFYTMYKRRPTGEYLVSVCTNTMCGVLGGDEIYAALKEQLGVGHDETTPDGKITLEHAECLAACDYAPVVTVNYEYFDQQDTESGLKLAQDLIDGKRPQPTRGAPLCSFKEMSMQIAGFLDPRPEARAADAVGEPTLAGLHQKKGKRPVTSSKAEPPMVLTEPALDKKPAGDTKMPGKGEK